MKREVLFLILDDYADWESAFLASALNSGVRLGGKMTEYVPKTVAPTLDGARSIGGFRTAADYDFDSMPDDYAALVLVGGLSWQSPEAERVIEIVRKATADKKIVGAICNGASFLAANGFLTCGIRAIRSSNSNCGEARTTPTERDMSKRKPSPTEES